MIYHKLFAVLVVFCAIHDTLGLALGLDSLGGLTGGNSGGINNGMGGGNIGGGGIDGGRKYKINV